MGHETPPVGVPTIPNAEPAIRRGAERTRARMRSCGWYAPGALKGRPAGALLRVAPLGQVRTRRVVDEPSVTPGGQNRQSTTARRLFHVLAMAAAPELPMDGCGLPGYDEPCDQCLSGR